MIISKELGQIYTVSILHKQRRIIDKKIGKTKVYKNIYNDGVENLEMYKVRAFITNEYDKVLMVKQNNRHNKVVWAFPGGKSKYNLKLYMKYLCKKKIKQKTGLKVKIRDTAYTENTLYMFKATVIGGS